MKRDVYYDPADPRGYFDAEEEDDYIPSWSSRNPDREPTTWFASIKPGCDPELAKTILGMFRQPYDESAVRNGLYGAAANMVDRGALGYSRAANIDESRHYGMKQLSADNMSGSGEIQNHVLYAGLLGKNPYIPNVVDGFLGGEELAEEVRREALARNDSPELARKKAEDARGLFNIWQAGAIGAIYWAGKKWGKDGAVGASAAGGITGHYAKKVIKEWALNKKENDYHLPLYEGSNPPGPY